MKKILLLNPPGKSRLLENGVPAHRKHCSPPLGLAYIAASLDKAGYDVKVIDMLAEGYDNERIIKSMCKAIKDNFNIPIIFGGYHATGAPHDCLKDLNVDYVMAGESDYTIIQL